jgi:hypothetical protein
MRLETCNILSCSWWRNIDHLLGNRKYLSILLLRMKMSSLTLKRNCPPCYLWKLRSFPSRSTGLGIMLDQPSITMSHLLYFSGLIITPRPQILASKKITVGHWLQYHCQPCVGECFLCLDSSFVLSLLSLNRFVMRSYRFIAAYKHGLNGAQHGL